jgi:hypothetical protein
LVAVFCEGSCEAFVAAFLAAGAGLAEALFFLAGVAGAAFVDALALADALAGAGADFFCEVLVLFAAGFDVFFAAIVYVSPRFPVLGR